MQEKKREDKPPSLIFNKHLFGPLSTVLLFFPLTECQPADNQLGMLFENHLLS